MIAKIISALPQGYNGCIIEVEGDSSRGLPAFNIVGMANKTIEESRERVRSAILNSTFTFPNHKVTINLAPAELHKDGAYLDLPIALAVLVLSSQLLQSDVSGKLFVGELSLTGDLRPVRGIINIIESAKQAKIKEVFLPQQNLAQASLISGVTLFGVASLKSLFLHLKGERILPPPTNIVKNTKTDSNMTCLDHICGQAQAKRAVTIAVAGHHNIIISGPPGAGKTMLAKAAVNLLPALSDQEKLSVTKIHSLSNSIENTIESRPFRSPHHTSSLISLIGGGPRATPGEISLAHLGVLFLDELPEYSRNFLESLRQPLEDKLISVSRVNQKTIYPADFMLIATMNPCPCGFLGSSDHECSCSPQQLQSYTKKLSGPLLDRIDMMVDVSKVENSDLLRAVTDQTPEHCNATASIATAKNLQRRRYHNSNIYNASISSSQISKKFLISPPAKILLEKASAALHLSARSYFKVLKVSRTIADLESSPEILESHLSEALQYRRKP